MSLADLEGRRAAVLPGVSRGVKIFSLIWLTQVVSLFGSGLSGFALGILAYRKTHSVTAFAFMTLSLVLPGILFSPLAGALVDRWNRRWALILSDAGAGLCTLAIAVLLAFDTHALWPIYGLLAVSSLFDALQWPAYSAAVTELIPKRHFGRASGMIQFGAAAGQILAPLVAGFLVNKIEIYAILLIDLATCVFAVVTLLSLRVRLGVSETSGGTAISSLLSEARRGWTYIWERPGLLGLLLFLAVINLAAGFSQALVAPLVLSFSSEAKLGMVLAVAGGGLLAGSLAMSVFGGPRRRMQGVLGFGLLYGLFYFALGLRSAAWLIAAAYAGLLFMVPLINGCSQAIWQIKVPLGLQGRVFAVRRMVAQSSLPLALLVAGPLADRFFAPLLTSHGPLTGSVGRLIGIGPGRGIGLLLIVLSVLVILAALIGLMAPHLRRVEQEVPDAICD